MAKLTATRRTRSAKRAHSPKPILVYGIYQGSLVFADYKQARELAAFWQARTWGRFRATAPNLYREAVGRWTWDEEDPPKDSRRLIHAEVPGVEDGDFPPWLLKEMLHVLPRDVALRFARPTFSYASGDALTIPPENEKTVVRAIRGLGFRCTKNQRLISRAGGNG